MPTRSEHKQSIPQPPTSSPQSRTTIYKNMPKAPISSSQSHTTTYKNMPTRSEHKQSTPRPPTSSPQSRTTIYKNMPTRSEHQQSTPPAPIPSPQSRTTIYKNMPTRSEHKHSTSRAPFSSPQSHMPYLYTELQEEIISSLWGLSLSAEERKHIISSLLLVNKHWKNTLLICTLREIHFTSRGQYLWYRHVTKNGNITFADCNPKMIEEVCKSIILDASNTSCMTDKFNWLNWNTLPAPHFLNIHRVCVNSVNVQCLGLEGGWGWVKHIPQQVDTLELTFIDGEALESRDNSDIDRWKNSCDTSMCNTSITQLYVWGVDDEDLTWSVFIQLFPNLATLFCNGKQVSSSPKPQCITLDEFYEKWIEFFTLQLASQIMETFTTITQCDQQSCSPMYCIVSQAILWIWEWIGDYKTDDTQQIVDYFDSVLDFLIWDPVFDDVTNLIWKELKQVKICSPPYKRISFSSPAPRSKGFDTKPRTFATEFHNRFWRHFLY
ncbi:hypothetical protein BDQ17DRAFT_1432556 [Cyathus striatus]|nr:hypothetical protein BDQ17DRAFT_1432556 [Cyathus striatus]